MWKPTALVVVAILAFFADVVTIGGVHGSLRVLLLTAVSAIGLASALEALRRIRTLSSEVSALRAAGDAVESRDLVLIELSDAWTAVTNERLERLRCFGSGSETYLNLILEGVRRHVIDRNTVIEVGFRLTREAKRNAKLRHFDSRWQAVIQEHQLQVAFLPTGDFEHALRGVVMKTAHEEVAALGLYVRRKGVTYGQGSPLFLVKEQSVLYQLIMPDIDLIFSTRTAYASIGAAIAG